MEFWGVEVKSGEKVTVEVDDEKYLHLTQSALGESKKKGTDRANLFLTLGDQKLVLGTLSAEKFPQLTFDLVFEKTFELSHNWKNGSIYFTGYKKIIDDGEDFDGFPDFPEEEELLTAAENGKPAKAKPAGEKDAAAKAKVEVESSEESSEEDSDDSDEEMGDAEDSDDSDDDSEEEEETPTPKKALGNKKRQAESATKKPESSKKAKVATPEKKVGKNVGHTATPHPAKKTASKTTPNADKSKSPKSGGEVSCKTCSRSFRSEKAMEAHSKAKHSGK